MNTLRVLASPRVWGPIPGVVAVLALVFYAYLGAVVSPEENLEDLPIALVNVDRGGDLAGKDVNLGDRVVEKIAAPGSPAAGTVDWIRPGTRGEALEGIGNGEYYGAIVIPRDYTQRISGLAGPPTIPIAVVGEDRGAEMNGQPVELGEEVANRITSPDSPAPEEQGAQLTPEVAAVIGDPVRADAIEAQPVGPDSGNGQSPFFLAFLVNLSGLIGGAAIFFLVGGAAESLEARGLRPSRTGLWTVRLLLGLAYALLIAGAELWVAFGLLGVEHEASTAQVYLFLALATTAAASVTMLLAVAFGPAGIGISAVLNVILGLVSSGGLAPLEALPPFYQAYADWLSLRYVIDGLRSLLFYDGSLDAARLEGGWRDSLWFLGGGGRTEAAGFEDAVWMIGAYLLSAAALGYLISLVRDLYARRERPKAGKGAEAAR